jgi:hypothetical protein
MMPKSVCFLFALTDPSTMEMLQLPGVEIPKYDPCVLQQVEKERFSITDGNKRSVLA